MKKITKHQIQSRTLEIRQSENLSIDIDNRTVELTWSTGFKGLRSGWDGNYYEELCMDSKCVDMSRLQSGAPLLDAHDSYSNRSVIGVVEKAWLDGNQGKALVRFAKDPISDDIFQKVKDKILRNVSVGYQVRKYEDVTLKGEPIQTLRATNWQPREISIVPIGFDPNAQIRAGAILTEEVEIELQETKTEADSITSTTVEPQADLQKKDRTMTEAEKQALELAAKKQAAQEEKTRQTEIRQAVRAAKLEEVYADELINQDLTSDKARQLVLEKLAAKQPETVNNTVRVEVGNENDQAKREGFEESLLYRMDNKNFALGEKGKLFYGKSLLRQIEQFVPRHTMESDSQFAKRAMASSDLPLALANVAEKGLQKQYELQPRSFEKWSRKDSLRNYKEYSQVKSGDYASLIERPENGEFQMGSISEKNEVAQLKDYGIIHPFSSQMLINDDLGVLTRLASSGGIAASRLENRLAYLALSTNKTMKDGLVLYVAGHGNLGTAGAISATTVAEAYKLMRKQTSTSGLDALNLYPKFFVCGPDQESTARQFFASVNATQTSNINIYSGQMEVIVDAQLTGNQYYFLADPNVIDTIVCYRLEGQDQPSIESRVNFSTNSLELKIAHAFAAAPMDFRGIVKNAGQ